MSGGGRSVPFDCLRPLCRQGARTVVVAVFIVILTATGAWAGNGNDGNSGNPGPGTPGDANDHCQSAKCSSGDGSDPDPPPDPSPAPEPEPEPSPRPSPIGEPGDPPPPSSDDSTAADVTDDPASDDTSDNRSAAEGRRTGREVAGSSATGAGPRLALPSHPRTVLSGSRQSDPPAGQTTALLGFAIAGLTGLVMGARRPTRMGELADNADDLAREDLDDRVGVSWGDRSFTWRFPGVRYVDAASTTLPPKISRLSPFLARLANDGSEFRAAFGALWLLTPVAGAAIGALSALATDTQPLPPPVLLLGAGIVIATFDALSGAVAALVFALTSLVSGGLLASGGPSTMRGILVLLAVTFLWCSLPIIGSAVRPFRRIGPRSLKYTWDRAADLAISSLLCAWIAGNMVAAMDVFAGVPTGLPQYKAVIAAVTLAAVAARIGAEQLTTALYPSRLVAVEPSGPAPDQPMLAQIAGAIVRTAIFSFMGFAFTGPCWQWWVGSAVFLLPQLLGVVDDRIRKIELMQRILPRGIVEIFILIVACTLAARLATTRSPSELAAVQWVFLALSVPPAIIGLLSIFASSDSSGTPRLRPWIAELLGLVIFVATTWLALHGWSY